MLPRLSELLDDISAGGGGCEELWQGAFERANECWRAVTDGHVRFSRVGGVAVVEQGVHEGAPVGRLAAPAVHRGVQMLEQARP